MRENRGYWFMLTGLVIGLGLGLFYGWVISPVEYTDTAPSSLLPEIKDQYRSMIALAFQADGNIGRAQVRMALIKDADPVRALANQSEQVVAEGGSVAEGVALQKLALALREMVPAATPGAGATLGNPTVPAAPSLDTTPVATQESTEEGVSPGETPTDETGPAPSVPTFTPRATSNALPTIGAPFGKQESAPVCNPAQLPGLLVVEVMDSGGNPLPGMKLSITWDGGSSSFFTGLFPRVSLGYADFTMQPGKNYSLRVGESGDVVNDIAAPECKNTDSSTYTGGWKVTFIQK